MNEWRPIHPERFTDEQSAAYARLWLTDTNGKARKFWREASRKRGPSKESSAYMSFAHSLAAIVFTADATHDLRDYYIMLATMKLRREGAAGLVRHAQTTGVACGAEDCDKVHGATV